MIQFERGLFFYSDFIIFDQTKMESSRLLEAAPDKVLFSSFSYMYLQNLRSSRKTMYLIFLNLSLKLNNQYCQVVKLIYFSRNERVGDVQQLSRVVYTSV